MKALRQLVGLQYDIWLRQSLYPSDGRYDEQNFTCMGQRLRKPARARWGYWYVIVQADGGSPDSLQPLFGSFLKDSSLGETGERGSINDIAERATEVRVAVLGLVAFLNGTWGEVSTSVESTA